MKFICTGKQQVSRFVQPSAQRGPSDQWYIDVCVDIMALVQQHLDWQSRRSLLLTASPSSQPGAHAAAAAPTQQHSSDLGGIHQHRCCLCKPLLVTCVSYNHISNISCSAQAVGDSMFEGLCWHSTLADSCCRVQSSGDAAGTTCY
jgi:hypothetical protein